MNHGGDNDLGLGHLGGRFFSACDDDDMPTVVDDRMRQAAGILLSRLYDLEQSHASLSAQSQDGAIDSALLRSYYLDVAQAMRAVQGLEPDERDVVTRAILDLTQYCLDLADEAHRKWSGGANVAERL
jgi:hypothetical protein